MDVFQHIREFYNEETLRLYRSYEKKFVTLKRIGNQLNFLKDCIKEQVIPRTYGHIAKPAFSGEPYPTYAHHFLLDRIQETKMQKDHILFELRRLRSELCSSLPDVVFEGAMIRAGEVASFKDVAHKRSIFNKLESLCNTSPWEKYSNQNNVIVLSNLNIDRYQITILSLGLSFSLGHGRNDLVQSISQINRFNHSHPEIDVNFLKGICLQSFGNSEYNDSIPKRYILALSRLKSNKNIKVLKADKGGAAIVMDLNDYKIKALRILNDHNTYEKLENPPSIFNIQQNFNKSVKTIIRLLPPSETKITILSKLSSRLPSFSYFYGAPKVHKDGIPLRPIIATCGSPQSDLAKWLANNLSPLLGKISDSHLLHSYDFIDRLKQLGPVRGKMMSLDVTALFTNVPLDFVLNNLKDAAEADLFNPPVHIDIFCELIKLCVESTIFTFDGVVYKQKFGVAMGSPLSPILANLCLEFLEKNYIKTLPEDIRALFWVRYVDDVFIVYEHNEEKFSEFLNHINNIIPSIKFTVEQEENGKIPFLDVLVIHDSINLNFSFSVYRKPTNTEGYIHFFSRHSKTVKQNVVTNMFSRALRICDPLYIDEELLHIEKSFIKLGYPPHFIRKCQF